MHISSRDVVNFQRIALFYALKEKLKHSGCYGTDLNTDVWISMSGVCGMSLHGQRQSDAAHSASQARYARAGLPLESTYSNCKLLLFKTSLHIESSLR